MTARPRRPLGASWALAAAAALALLGLGLLPGLAGATAATGDSYFRLANHDRGRTLSGQGVAITTTGGSTNDAGMLVLPLNDVDFGNAPSVGAGASLNFVKGKKTVAFTDLRFDLSGAVIKGKLAGKETTVFRLTGTPAVNATAGTASLGGGKLRVIRDAANVLRAKLGLKKALRGDGVGMVWLAATAKPTRAAASKIVAGEIAWGVLTSWRGYILKAPPAGPPPWTMPYGTIEVGDGATATGPLDSSATTFGFPVNSGSFARGLYGATSAYAVKSGGFVAFHKPTHCINTVQFSNLEAKIEGTKGALLGDTFSDIYIPNACTPAPTTTQSGVEVAQLDLGGITPTESNNGKTTTWTNVPATLTSAGAVAFGGSYQAGQALDPVTITATAE